jgi:hypothetical protein
MQYALCQYMEKRHPAREATANHSAATRSAWPSCVSRYVRGWLHRRYATALSSRAKWKMISRDVAALLREHAFALILERNHQRITPPLDRPAVHG